MDYSLSGWNPNYMLVRSHKVSYKVGVTELSDEFVLQI